MRIGIDIRCLASGKRTGVEEYTQQLLENMFILDRDNEYILFVSGYKPIEADLSWTQSYTHVLIRRLHWPNKVLNFCLWYFHRPYIDTFLGGVDIFFMPNMNFVALSAKARLFVTAHDLSFERYPETFSWKRRLWHTLVHFRGLCRRAEHIFAVSQSTADDLTMLYGISKKKVTPMLSGVSGRFVELNRNDPELLTVQKTYHLPYHFILYLGTVEPRKNVSALLRAYAQLQRTDNTELQKYALVIAGARGWKSDEVFAEIEAHPFRDRIIVTDFVEDKDKRALYNLASLFVYPSLFEGFGLPPVEAMRCGVPVITSNTSSFPEVIGSAGILLDPYRPDDFARAMEEVLSDKDVAEQLRQNGFKRSAELTWQYPVREIMRHFRKNA